MANNTPIPEFCIRSRDGIKVYQAPVKGKDDYSSNVKEVTELYDSGSDVDREMFNSTNSKAIEYSPTNGSALAILDAKGAKVFDTSSRQQKQTIGNEKVQAMSVSPLGSFLVTWSKYEKGSERGNLVVWRIEDGAEVLRLFEKSYLTEKWPTIKWTPNEEIAGHMVRNTIHIYKGHCLEDGIIHKAPYEGVTAFSITTTPGPECPEFPFRIATFKPDIKGKPAQIAIFNFPGSPEIFRSKSFFRAEGIELKWSPLGNALLAKTETSVDATGQSYYGESGVYLIRCDEMFDCNLRSSTTGNFQDISWSPKGREFIAISGKMPALACLYNLKGEPIFEFGSAHRNTIRWSPHGRFVCLGGFGNLAGDMDFWDVNKKKQIGSAQSNCAVKYEWSPCGRYFMTSTLFPRMRVDNGFTVFSYRGEKVFEKKDFKELYDAIWKPASKGIYPDRAQSPIREEKVSDSNQDEKLQEKKPFRAYRPPGATSKLAEKMRAEREGNGPKKIVSVSPVVSKAKARRERKKLAAARAAEQTSTAPKQSSQDENSTQGDELANVNKTYAEAQASKYNEQEKALRKYKKQLKSILELEKKLKDGAELNEAQMQKLERKSEIEAEIKALS